MKIYTVWHIYRINEHMKLYILWKITEGKQPTAEYTFHAQGQPNEVINFDQPPILAIPASSKGSDFCCAGSIRGVIWSKHYELIWNHEKFKYLLVSLSPPETSQPYNSHRKGQNTTAIQVSAGPGKINPHWTCPFGSLYFWHRTLSE